MRERALQWPVQSSHLAYMGTIPVPCAPLAFLPTAAELTFTRGTKGQAWVPVRQYQVAAAWTAVASNLPDGLALRPIVHKQGGLYVEGTIPAAYAGPLSVTSQLTLSDDGGTRDQDLEITIRR